MNSSCAGMVPRDDAAPDAADALVEVLLLLPDRQLAALETVARARGVTTGALARSLIDDFLRRRTSDRPFP